MYVSYMSRIRGGTVIRASAGGRKDRPLTEVLRSCPSTIERVMTGYWQCLHTMRTAEHGLCNGRVSVRLSVPFYRALQQRAAGLLKYWAPGGQDIDGYFDSRRRRSAATAPQHSAQQQMRTVLYGSLIYIVPTLSVRTCICNMSS